MHFVWGTVSCVVPPDSTCSKLPPLVNGGTIYSNLHLSPGTVGRYMCNAGYILYGRREFACTEDGVWDGDVIEVPASCICKNFWMDGLFK